MTYKGNCWPTELQELLLSAALCEKTKAEQAWKEYVSQADLKKVEGVSICIFPLVYRNIQHSSIASESLAICKSKYRFIWVENHIRFYSLSKVLEAFSTANIDACLLKGTALVVSCYRDLGMRVMGDVDVLVSKEQFWDAVTILKNFGWECLIVDGGEVLVPEKPLNFHAITFVNAKGDRLDLHWKFSPWAIFDAAIATLQLKQGKINSTFLRQAVSVLMPEDQLLHTLIHGLKHSQEPLIRWIYDATYIIRHSEKFNWDYFLEQGEKGDLFFVIQEALLYLHQKSFIELPEFVHLRLEQHKASALEKLYFKCLTESNDSFLARFRVEWYQHIRNLDSKNAIKALFSFPGFLMERWNANNIISLFLIICRRWFFRIVRRVAARAHCH